MNIFVARLNYSSSEDSLRDLFERFGSVDSVKVVMDRETGRSKGFGFVEMTNDDDGLIAIEELNESDFEGRSIVVKKAEPRSNDRGGGGGWR
jgi:RNA recognition motif-containing protein